MEQLNVDKIFNQVMEIRKSLNLPEDEFEKPLREIPIETLLKITLTQVKERVEEVREYYELIKKLP